jgi:hypothetical protein
MKIGLGALLVRVRKLTEEDKVALEAAMKDFSTKRFLLFDKRVEEFGFVGASGSAVNFDDYIDSVLDQIAAGTDVPKTILTGQEQGAITGAELNNKALYATINKIQQSVEPYVREVIARFGYTEEDYVISWNTRFAHDELEKAQIRVLNAQADEAEARIEQMSQGNLPGDIRVRMQTPEAQEKTNNPSGTQ